MFSWLNSAIGSKLAVRALTNPESLTRDQLIFLARDLGRLERVRFGYGYQALVYVVDGGEPAVVEALTQKSGGGTALRLACVELMARPLGGSRLPERRRFLAGLDPVQAVVMLRLGEVYEAASRRQGRQLRGPWSTLPEWCDVLLQEVAELDAWGNVAAGKKARISLFEAALTSDGDDPSLLARVGLLTDPEDGEEKSLARVVQQMPGFRACLEQHRDVVEEGLQASMSVKVATLEQLTQHEVDLGPHLERLAELAVGPSKTVREVAEPLLQRSSSAVLPSLRSLLVHGGPSERAQAARLLTRLAGVEGRGLLEEQLEKDDSVRVRSTLRQLLASLPQTLPAASSKPERTVLSLPALEPPAKDAKVPLELENRLHDFRRAWLVAAREQWQRSEGLRSVFRMPEMSAALPARLCSLLETLQFSSRPPTPLESRWNWNLDLEVLLQPVLATPGLEPIHFVRLMVLLGEVRRGSAVAPDRDSIGFQFEPLARAYRSRSSAEVDLRQLALAMSAIGIDPHCLGWECLSSSVGAAGADDDTRLERPFDWGADAVWPYFVEYPRILDEVLGMRPRTGALPDHEQGDARRRAYEVLALFPSLPARYKARVWEAALGGSKVERELAQEIVGRGPEVVDQVVQALDHSRREIRQAAADWLRRLGDTRALGALSRRFTSERSELVQGALLDAIEALGGDVGECFDPERVLQQAQAGLARPLPVGLHCVPFVDLPEVRWQRTGEAVPEAILRWLVCRSLKRGGTKCQPLQCRLVEQFTERDRHRLGEFLLQAWLRQETDPAPEDEVRGRLRREAAAWALLIADLDEDRLYERLLNQALGSGGLSQASKGRGVLALAGACGGPGVVALSQRFLSAEEEERQPIGRSLIEMLASVDDLAAGDVVLWAASEHPVRAVRKAARRVASEVAERRGLSTAELLDRTVPTAGLRTGEGRQPLAILSAAPAFRAELREDLSVSLLDVQGRRLERIPKASDQFTAEELARACGEWRRIRRLVRSVARRETERLFEALCRQRVWSLPSWSAYVRNPIVGTVASALVWVTRCSERESAPRTFRRLATGQYVDAEGRAFALPDSADSRWSVRLAQESCEPEGVTAAWRQHLQAAQIVPPFVQFADEPFELTSEQKQATELRDFEGMVLRAFDLPDVAARLGYDRCEGESDSDLLTYKKAFPNLDLEAIVEFSHPPLPGDRAVALLGLYFVSRSTKNGGGWRTPKLALGHLPAPLLGRCWNDLRQIAELAKRAEG